MSTPIFSRRNTISLYLVYALIVVMVTAVALGILVATTDVFGSEQGKGLKVFVTINTNLVSQPVYLDTFQFGQFVGSFDSYMNNGASETVIQFENGEMQTGDFEICAIADEGMKQCATGYNGEEKEPEYMTIGIYSNNTPQPVYGNQPQSQAQSSNNENNNALSQSQGTTIYICKEGGCTKQ